MCFFLFAPRLAQNHFLNWYQIAGSKTTSNFNSFLNSSHETIPTIERFLRISRFLEFDGPQKSKKLIRGSLTVGIYEGMVYILRGRLGACLQLRLQAWHVLRSTFVLLWRRGTFRIGLDLVARLVPVCRP